MNVVYLDSHHAVLYNSSLPGLCDITLNGERRDW